MVLSLTVACFGELIAADESKSSASWARKSDGRLGKHPACFRPTAQWRSLSLFFSGQEVNTTITAPPFSGARLTKDGTPWSSPVPIARDPFHSLAPGSGRRPTDWSGCSTFPRYGTHWADSRIAGKVSRDGARTRSDSFMVSGEEGMMVRGHPIVLHSGDFLLPIYHGSGRDTEKWDAHCTSLFFNSIRRPIVEAGGRVRSRLGTFRPRSNWPNHLLALCRRGGDYAGRPDGWLVRTESRDGGRTWSEGADSEFPNPNAAVDFIKLRNGHLLLVFNDSFTNRSPLTVAISTDNAKTFPHRRNIAEGPGDFGYPTAVQTSDEKIHILYTSDERTVIRHAVFAEAAILKQR
jgi:hypothetical protein